MKSTQSKKTWSTPQIIPLGDTHILSGRAVAGVEKQFVTESESCRTASSNTTKTLCSSTENATAIECDMCS